ncbi:MAG: metallophosphoesterase family protein, partial [Nanoarchaeota archaeon]|nr:metallophosphoesterase family protein [Nanoarchaeota archaeon]
GMKYDDNRCINSIKSKRCIAVRGNHDDDICAALDYRKISPDNVQFLADLPDQLLAEEKYFLLHAPSNRRIVSVEEATEEFPKLPKSAEISFFGHSHQQAVFCKDATGCTEQKSTTKSTIYLRPGNKYMINPGGVGLYWGQQKTYLIYDDQTRLLHLRKLL